MYIMYLYHYMDRSWLNIAFMYIYNEYTFIFIWYIVQLHVPTGEKDSFLAETSITLKIPPEVLSVFWSIVVVWTDPSCL